MTTACLPWQPQTLAPTAGDFVSRRLLVGFSALIIGLVFFVAGHDLRVSLAEAYTQNAEQMEIAAAGGNALRRVAFVALAAYGVVLLLAGRSRLAIDPPLAAAIGMLATITVMSFAWADDAGLCLRRLMLLVCCAISAVGVARSFTLRELCWLVIATIGGLAVVGLLAEVALGTFRPWGADYRFAGTVHPNTQGPALAMLCLAAVSLADSSTRGHVWLWLIFATAFGLLLLTKSRTTTAAIIVSLVAVQVAKTSWSWKLTGIAGLGWLSAAGLWLLWVCGIDPLTDFHDALLLGRAEESDTLSGRAFIWPEVLSYIQERWWLGYGYESFWTAGRIETISDRLGWGLREAHNAYLETVLAIGLVGLIALLAMMATGCSSALRAWRQTGEQAHAVPLGMLLFALINAGFESGMVAISLVPFLLGCMLLRLALFRKFAETQP